MKKMEKEGYKVITIGVERETGLPLDNHVSETEIKYCVEKLSNFETIFVSTTYLPNYLQ